MRMGSTPIIPTLLYIGLYLYYMKITTLYNEVLTEGLEGKKSISVTYLKGLLNNVHNNLAKQYLTNWIMKGVQGTVSLSPKEYTLLGLIQSGGILPKNFSTKN